MYELSQLENVMRRWDAVAAFVEVIERGSFTAAAQALEVSPSYISRRIAELEADLGTPLIYRSTRSIRLSDVGANYYQECSRLLRGFTEAEERISQQQTEPFGVLKLTCATTFGERFIAPLLPDFIRRYPKLKIDFNLSNERVDLINDGYDLAIRLGRLEDSSLIARRLCDRSEYICASTDYLAEHGAPSSLADLSSHNCLLGSSKHWLVMDQGQRRELKVEGSWRSNSGPALLEAVKAGLGIAQLPDYYVDDLMAEGSITSVLEQHRYPLSGVWLVYPRARQQLPSLKLLCDYLVENFQK